MQNALLKGKVPARLIAIAILLLFGAVRLRFEQQLTNEHRAAYFHSAQLNLDLRQQLGQMGFLAALSGFRATAADVLWIQANSAFQRVEWGRMKLLLEAVTSLQPRCEMFWDLSAWHMAFNASASALEDRKQPREILRVKAQREYFKIGEDFLLRGIQNNPDKETLYEKLAFLYEQKFRDHLKAFEYYRKAATFPEALGYVKRFAAYHLAEIPGRESEAYAELVALYNMGEKEWADTLFTKLNTLEEKLNIPADKKIPRPPQPASHH
ncbi:MAG: hypothetical protein JWL90_696 [Chthoniobacteraceae bacterium]|nr:hypothetical protein [Chthoniobacteraceae bacterium]